MTQARAGYQPPAADGGGDRSLVGRLLAHAATGATLGGDGRRFAWRADDDGSRQFRWALDGGLGPLLWRAAADRADAIPAPWRDQLISADLTARVRHASFADTMLDVVDAAERLPLRVTALKGISVSEQLYPAEHLRPMGDIDVLIPPEAYAALEAALLQHGFERLDYEASPGHHHGAPLRHVRRRTIVELHTLLFDDDTPLRDGTAFGPANVAARSVDSHYHGRPIRRLAPELQLAYMASSWVNDLWSLGVHPSFVATLFDAVYLLTAAGSAPGRSEPPAWLDNDMAKASLLAMLTYLARYGVEPPPPAFQAHLASCHGWIDPLQLRLMHMMVERHLVGGRPWTRPILMPVPGRYSLRRQFERRVLGRLRRG